MKKLLSVIIFFLPLLLFGQTQTFTGNVIIKKTAPALLLQGSGALINFNSGDLILTQSTNKLTLSGGNLIVPNTLTGYITTATAADTTRLTSASDYLQYFTGVTTHLIILPTSSTLTLGQKFLIVNNSTGLVTLKTSGYTTVLVLGAGTSAELTCILASGTTAASWNASYLGIGITSGKKLSASNTLILAGTDGTTMTFPTTSATIARTDAANTFTGHQTIEGVTSTGATGTGNFVFDTSPSITTAINPVTDGASNIGTTALKWGHLYLDSIATINFNNGDVTLTHAINTLTLEGGDLALGSNNITMTGSIASTGSRVTKAWASEVETNILAITTGDTTVTAVKGRVVFQTADSSFYGCRSILAGKKWYKLDN